MRKSSTVQGQLTWCADQRIIRGRVSDKEEGERGLTPQAGLWLPHMHRGTPPPTMQNISFSVSWLLLLIIMIYQVIPQLPICTKRKVVFLLHFP